MLAFAVTFDLVVMPLVLYYVVMVRKVGAAKIFLAGVIVAKLLLPESSKTYSSKIEMFVGFVEFSIIALLIINIRKVKKMHRKTSTYSRDLVLNLRGSYFILFTIKCHYF
jgi:hypothetical protein